MTGVAITGIGVASPLGNSLKQFEQNTLASNRFLEMVSFENQSFVAARTTQPLEIDNPRRFIYADRSTHFAIHASCQAMADAGHEQHQPDRNNFGVFMGSGLAGFEQLETAYEKLYRQNNARVRPSTVINIMANAPTAQISIEHGATGPSNNCATACASSSMAILQGASFVREHGENIAIVGGTEAPLNYGQMICWLASGAYTAGKTGKNHWTTPFANDRNGMALGEGSVVFVLEDLEKVKKQNRSWYAEIAGGAITSNANNIVQSDLKGQVRVMTNVLKMAGVTPGDIDYINAHATGTPSGDLVEAQAIATLRDDAKNKVVVSSLKGSHGHLLGASGAIGLLATIVGMKNKVYPGNAGCHELDPQIAELIDVPLSSTRTANISTALVNSFAFGGHNCTIVVKAP